MAVNWASMSHLHTVLHHKRKMSAVVAKLTVAERAER